MMQPIKALLDLLFPPLCLLCGEPVDEAHVLCPACWKKIRFIAPPFCACCGTPFEVPVEEGTLCPDCLVDPPAFSKARSALIYDKASKGMILRLKHADHLHLVRGMADMMARAGSELLAEADLLMPVPLHRMRLFLRRANQAALLAQALGKKTGKPVDVLSLRRIRATPSQGHLKREERRKNVTGAFAVQEASRVLGKKILLVDDVLTTGATVNACAEVLLKAGAAEVFVLTFAKTHRD